MRQTESKIKKGEKKRETWTFQPSPDVIALVQELGISTKNRGERTKLVNEAMRMAAKQLGASERAAIYRELSAEFAARADKSEGRD